MQGNMAALLQRLVDRLTLWWLNPDHTITASTGMQTKYSTSINRAVFLQE